MSGLLRTGGREVPSRGRPLLLVLALLALLSLAKASTTLYTWQCNATPNPYNMTFNAVAAGRVYCEQNLRNTCSNSFPMNYPLQFAQYAANTGAAVAYSNVAFKRGWTQAPLAIIAGSRTKGPLWKIQFWIETDLYSMIQVKNSFGYAALDPTDRSQAGDVDLKVEFAGKTSSIVRRASADGAFVVPYMTIIIHAENGVVQGLTWDNSCTGCVEGACIDGSCGSSYDDCTTHNKGIDCDIKIYIGWRGSDRSGSYLLSAQQTISNFRRFAAMIAVDWGARTYGKIASQVPGQNPDPPDITFP